MERIKNILGQLLRSVPQYEHKTAQMAVLEAWPRVVGERTAQHTWPITMLEGGLLLIAAENSAWLQSLKFLEPQILEKYEAALGSKKVKGLRFKMQSRSSKHE